MENCQNGQQNYVSAKNKNDTQYNDSDSNTLHVTSRTYQVPTPKNNHHLTTGSFLTKNNFYIYLFSYCKRREKPSLTQQNVSE